MNLDIFRVGGISLPLRSIFSPFSVARGNRRRSCWHRRSPKKKKTLGDLESLGKPDPGLKSMGDLQDPIHGGTLVPYKAIFWGISPYIGLI